MKKAIVTFGTGPHAEYLEIARPSFKAFSALHNYSYFEAEQIGRKRPAPWYKVTCLLELLREYDIAVFFGADLVVVDGREDFPLGNYDVPLENWPWVQAMVRHNTSCGDVPNDDMWICNQRMIPWLEKVWTMEQYMHHGWWEQAALLDLMGYDPAIENFPTYCKDTMNELYQKTLWLGGEWNVHVWDTPQPPIARIQHATMWPDRAGVMKVWAKMAEGWIDDTLH